MKKLIILSIIITEVLFSCKKDALNENNGNLLLSKSTNNNHTGNHAYNINNQLIESLFELSSGESYKFKFYYNNDNLLEHFEQYEISQPEKKLIYSFEYHLDDGYYISENIIGKITYYVDSLSRVYNKNSGNLSVYTKYINDNYNVDLYFNRDRIFVGDIEITYDDMKSPFPNNYFGPFQKPHNIISYKSNYADASGSIAFDLDPDKTISNSPFTPQLYNSTFEYNIQGYPTKETRWYNNLSEPDITYFEYIKEN